MNRFTSYLVVGEAAAFICCSTATAQNKRKGKASEPAFTKPRTEIADSLMKAYLFDEAKDIIDADINSANAANYPTDKLKLASERATLGTNMLEATEKVVVIDSIVTDKAQFLKAISLDASCGSILNGQEIKQLLVLSDTPLGYGYSNNFADHIIYSQKISEDKSELMSTNLFGNKWSSPQALEGLSDEGMQDYPFLMSDGITLYFAADNSNSLGGYDIFITRFNANTNSYVKPENVGMPFNSPFNDYMMAFDEVNQLGWFVSDRYQPEGKVCVYIFIPTETRETYSDLDDEELIFLASLRSIKATQKDFAKEVAAAKDRLQTARKAETGIETKSDFCFDVANGIRYTSIEQFKNKNAKKLAEDLTVLYSKQNQLLTMLNENRIKFGECKSETEKKTLSPIILRQEHEYEALKQQIKDLENKIRQTEIN